MTWHEGYLPENGRIEAGITFLLDLAIEVRRSPHRLPGGNIGPSRKTLASRQERHVGKRPGGVTTAIIRKVSSGNTPRGSGVSSGTSPSGVKSLEGADTCEQKT